MASQTSLDSHSPFPFLIEEEQQDLKRKRSNSEASQASNPLQRIESLSNKLLSQCRKNEKEANSIGNNLCLPCLTEIKNETNLSGVTHDFPVISFNCTDNDFLSKIELQMAEVDLLMQRTYEAMKEKTSCEACRFSSHSESMFA
jgi:hypothetical protein